MGHRQQAMESEWMELAKLVFAENALQSWWKLHIANYDLTSKRLEPLCCSVGIL